MTKDPGKRPIRIRLDEHTSSHELWLDGYIVSSLVADAIEQVVQERRRLARCVDYLESSITGKSPK